LKEQKLQLKMNVIKYNIGENLPVGELDKNVPVSMNYWGFHPSIFKEIEKGLHDFMRANPANPTAEYYIPNIVTDMIVSKQMAVRVIPTMIIGLG
jgi:sigma54-dependent transcription regulator